MQAAKVVPLHPRLPASVPDAELVRRTLVGEAAASRELFDRYLPVVQGLIFRLAPRDVDHDDMVQDCLVGAFSHLAKLNEPAAFAGWVRAHAVHVVRHRLRKRALLRRLGLYRTEPLRPDFIAMTAPSDIVVELRRIYAALHHLPTDTRLALLLSRVEGLTYEEIARDLGVSLSTIKRRMRGADVALERALAKGRHSDVGSREEEA